MTQPITATYENRQDAERVRDRLARLGVDLARIRIEDDRIGADPAGPGIFDAIAQMIAPAAAARPRWRLSADVDAARAADLGGALDASPNWTEPEGRLDPRSFLFRETAERLVVEKEVRVREEVVMTRNIDTHVEELVDTVRSMEAEVERLDPAAAGQIGSMPR